MKYYEKPIVLANEELAEGVYAASGGNCWAPTITSVQDYVDGKHVFEVGNSHSTDVEHISESYTIEITCSAPVTVASRMIGLVRSAVMWLLLLVHPMPMAISQGM